MITAPSTPTALILSGGGARGAYQVGVIKAVSELFPKHAHNPFSIICGTSAGAINAVGIAASANNFRLASKKLEYMWLGLHVNHVYKAGGWDILKSLGRLGLSFLHQGIATDDRPLSLLDNAPLRELLHSNIQFRNIQKRINAGYLDALAITAAGYTNGESVCFYQGRNDLEPWQRGHRVGRPANITPAHLLASSAIPMVLPAEKIGDEYFGDGALRQLSPISPALHLGADRLFVIGVSGNASHKNKHEVEAHTPSLAQMAGHIYNSAFIDSLEADLEHFIRINDLIGMLENENPSFDHHELRRAEALLIQPSIEFDEVAAKHHGDLPFAMRTLLRTTGATKQGGGSSMSSYLLFESNFCKDLIQHGYEDGMNQEDDIRYFFEEKV